MTAEARSENLLDSIRTTAREMRARTQQSLPPYSTRQIVDACFPWVTVTGAALPPGVDEAVLSQSSGSIHLLYQRSLPTCAQRIAIAHGIGHLVFDCGSGELGTADIEERAELFARELLCPLEDLGEYATLRRCPEAEPGRQAFLDMVDEIASHFRVPQSVVHQRLLELTD